MHINGGYMVDDFSSEMLADMPIQEKFHVIAEED